MLCRLSPSTSSTPRPSTRKSSTSSSALCRAPTHTSWMSSAQVRRHRPQRSSPETDLDRLSVTGCFAITTVFSHADTVVICGSCTTVLCQPTGGKARLTEGAWILIIVLRLAIANSDSVYHDNRQLLPPENLSDSSLWIDSVYFYCMSPHTCYYPSSLSPIGISTCACRCARSLRTARASPRGGIDTVPL